jgi:hypothetical protein
LLHRYSMVQRCIGPSKRQNDAACALLLLLCPSASYASSLHFGVSLSTSTASAGDASGRMIILGA